MNQMDLLNEILKLEKEFPNNFEFGSKVRNLINLHIKQFDIKVTGEKSDIIL